MAPPCDLRVVRLTPALAERAGALQVTTEQRAYVGDAAVNVADTLRDPGSEGMAILCGDTVVGCYRLDFSPNAVTGRPYAQASVGLRAFLIDQRFQRRGLGVRAVRVLCADLSLRHPSRRVLLLAVHARNRAGIATYRKAGFVDTGTWLAGGRAGPQQLMLRPLGAPVVAPARMGEWPHG
jgi:GNAT superfamily N-acetyltransferase